MSAGNPPPVTVNLPPVTVNRPHLTVTPPGFAPCRAPIAVRGALAFHTLGHLWVVGAADVGLGRRSGATGNAGAAYAPQTRIFSPGAPVGPLSLAKYTFKLKLESSYSFGS
eukprot:1181306-Prorocentrum_minimum.AAC.2